MRVGLVAVRSFILSITVMLSGAGALYAQCGGSITSMEVIDSPSQDSAQINVGYALTGGGNLAITRRDDSTGSEAWAGGGNISGTGTFVGSSFFNCIPPGSYTYKAVLNADCNPPVAPDVETVARTYDTRPTASGSILSINADKTMMKVQLDYSFPYVRESSGTGNRRLYVYIDGVAYVDTYAFYLDPWQGSKTFDIGISCLGSGTHTVTFRAAVTPCYSSGCVCLESVSTTEPTFTIQQAKITSLSIEPVGDGRNFFATVGYSFEATPTDSRGINLYFNGQQYLAAAPCCSATGTFTKEFEFQSCLPPGTYPFTAQLVACRKPNDPRFTDEKTVPMSIPAKKGKIAIHKLYDATTKMIKVTVTHSLPPGITSAKRTVRVLERAGDNNTVISSIVLDGPDTIITPSTPTQLVLFHPQPAPSRTLEFQATLSFCNGHADAVTTWPCAEGCDGTPTGTPNPISFEDGNAGYSDSDPLPPLLDSFPLTRHYDSQHSILGAFGRGWVSIFDGRLFVQTSPNGDTISMTDERNGAFIFLRRNGEYSQLWPKGGSGVGNLTLETATGLYVHRSVGATTARLYRAGDGRFAGYRQIGTGRELRIEYDAGAPATVKDSWTDVTWTITANAATKRITAITSAGLTWQYLYTNDNLTSVLAPGGAQWRTYEYSNDLMTAARDPLGNLIEGHTYDASGRAIGESGPAEIDSVQYAAPGTTSTQLVTRVTMKSGAVTEATLRPIGNSWRTVKITGGCASCGARDAVYAYDADGHLTREQDANGYISVRSYVDDRLQSLQTHLEPAGCNPGTSPTHCMLDPDTLAAASLEATQTTLTTTYEYGDPLWPDKATAIVTPSIASSGGSRREVFAYHALTGAITAHSISGWNENAVQETHTTFTAFYGDANSFAPAFDPGGTFQPAWLALPQPPLRKSVDGPRTDVADVLSFVYYPVDSSVTPAPLRGRLAAVRNAAGQITRYPGYDSFGNATRVVDANGVASESTYDAFGRVVTSTLKGIPGCDTSKDPLCGSDLTISRTYASQAGPMQSEQRPAGGVTVYEYDSQGRVHSLSRGPAANDLRERAESTYDPLGGLKSAERFFARENAAWIEKRSESYSYDSLGQLQTATHPDGTSVAYTYDRLGRVASTRDENHAAANTSYSYDPAGRVATVQQTLTGAPNGFITTGYSYDLHGNLARVVDPNGNATDYHYDDFGRMVSQQSPVTGTTQYRYDEAGNLTFTQDANGTTTQRTYDALGRVTTSVSTKGASGETVTWTYDSSVAGDFATGRLSNMSDPSGSTSYVYERRGLLRQEIKAIDGSSYTTGYQHDADANRSLIRYPSGRTVAYTYDFAGRPQSASTGSTALVTSTRYLPFGPVSEIVYGNGTTKTMQYDSRYRVMQNGLAGPGGTIAAYDYAYDAVGNVTQLHDSTNPAFNRDFGYDDLNRLTTANSGSSLWGSGSYTYDRMGNVLSSALGANRQSSFAYSGTAPKITAATENGIPRSITYDAAGNESVVGTASFAYSPRNHLVASDGLNYAYDGRGVRVATSYPAVAIASLTVSPSTLSTNQTATGTVTLGAAAPAGGAVVSLTSSNPAVIVPATITVPAGGTTAIFGVALAANMSSGGAVITANYYLKRTAAVTLVSGPALSSIAVSPATLAGGSTAQGTITLQGAAPSAGATVLLSSSNAAVSVPSTVTIPANETTATFTVSSSPVSASASSTITATHNGTSTTTVTVNPARLTAVTTAPQTVMGGHSALGTVTLDGLAASDITVTLTSSNSQVTVPATVVIPAGTASNSFTILTSTSVSSPISVTITGTADGSTRFATLTVTACVPSTAVAPPIPAGDTVWIDDETLAGATLYKQPVWDTTQKASGTKSVTKAFQMGPWEMGFVGATSTMPVYYNENLVFYALLSECVPPTRITVQWRTTDGVEHNALWGVAHPAFPTIGPVPAAGGWVRFEVPARQLNMEGKTVDSVYVGGLDGQAWFDHFGKGGTGCMPATAAAPTIPSGDTVWIDDETPAGATLYKAPVWDATQKASGAKSVTKPFQMGPWEMGFVGATATMPVYYNENLVFYALLSECVPPTRITVQWRTTDGVEHNALWGVAHPAFPTIGPVPAAGGWVRFEVPARQLNMEGKTVDSVYVGGLNGQAWFDHFGKSGTACIPAPAPPPTIPSGDTVWFDDETPAGATLDGSPVWDATQKASGTKSLTKPFTVGEWWQGFIGASSTMLVYYNENLVFYALLNECVPPRRITIQWRTTDGVYHNALWGLPRASFPTIGPLPAAGGWVRFEVSARQLNMEGKTVDSIYVGGLDGQAWFDHFGKSGTACNPATVPPPSIPSGDTVWIDDETPAGATLYNQPVWDTTQKASGTKSLTKPFQLGGWETGLIGATAAMPVYADETVVFYALLNACVPPSRITIQWRTTDGVYHNALWGTPAHPAFPTIGPLPAAGSWARFEVPARQLNLEGKVIDSVFVGGLDGQAWFDLFGKAPAQPALLTSFSADRESPQPFGTAITWTATAAGAVPPLQYRFERQDGGTWSIVQAYSSASSYTWTSTASDIGDHAIRVSVRNSGSSVDFEDTRSLTMTIQSSSASEQIAEFNERDRPPVSLSVRAEFVTTSAGDAKRFSFYTPELNLLAETEASTATTPAVAYEYVWFGGQPLAQIEVATGTTHYYFNDHLGTPLLTTNGAAIVDWRIEREPFGASFTLRSGTERHQSLAFPGQEDDSTTERLYNIFRWYRSAWGRYTQADPMVTGTALTPYAYALANPLRRVDPRGAVSVEYNDPQYYPIHHSDIATKCGGTAWGCTLTWYKTTCDCKCSNGLWTPSISIKVYQEVYYTDDYLKPSVSWVITEELKHVLATQKFVQILKNAALLDEQVQYGNKWACQLECAAFKAVANFHFKFDGFLDDKKPWFHPNLSEADAIPMPH